MEETKTREEAVQEILDLHRGEERYIKIQQEPAARLWLLHMEIVSMNNLFATYVERYGQPEGNLKFDQLLEQYVKATADYTVTIQTALREQVGEELFQLLSNPANGYSYFYDSSQNAVQVVKNCPLPCMRGVIQ